MKKYISINNAVESVTDMERRELEAIVDELSDSERAIAELVFGLYGSAEHAYDEVAAITNMSTI